jgi:hypothetical protein
MTIETTSPKDETAASGKMGGRPVSSLPFRHSFVIQPSNFVIPASPSRKYFLWLT